jgi:hypothetical protein
VHGIGTILAHRKKEERPSETGRRIGLFQALLPSVVVMMMRISGLFFGYDIQRIALDNIPVFRGESTHFNGNA